MGGRHTCGGGTALGSTTGDCSHLWLAKYKQIVSQSPGSLWLNKYSKILNSCVSFESNRIASNYSIRFEISNIRTALVKNMLPATILNSPSLNVFKSRLKTFFFSRTQNWHS